VRILGADLIRESPASLPAEHTLVLLDDSGRVVRSERVGTLPEVAAMAGELSGGETFLLGVNVPVVVPAKTARARPVENLVRRRFGYRQPPGGRAALVAEPLGIAGEALIAGLATAGLPCLPYPDRDRRSSGLAEIHPGLCLKALLWESSSLVDPAEHARSEELFRAFAPPSYRAAKLPARSGWADQAVNLDLLLRGLQSVGGFDLDHAAEALGRAGTAAETERAAALLDASLIAGTARRYLESPESSLFLGDRESGYTILPADGFIRRLAFAEAKPSAGELFPQGSLRARLSGAAKVRSLDLLSVPGRPQRLEATFQDHPRYEFDNLDEMMWWKHCRHVTGPALPTEGLIELLVELDRGGSGGETTASPLRLARSRHRTLSFRFDPPDVWRTHVPTRDGRTYPFNVLRAVYETLPSDGA
jgi:predicted RNase H-like nuclease